VIQRIQTIYLGLAVIFTTAVFFTDLFNRILEDPAAWIFSAFVAAAVFSMVLSVWSIFKYTNRPAQSAMVAKALTFQIISIGVGVAVFFTLGSFSTAQIGEFVGVFFLVIGLLMQILARHSIEKDEKLVKSTERIR
jgi:ACR3 family arsenite efflux pump ArsB